MNVTVYSTKSCPGCEAVKSELSLKGVLYDEVRVDKDPEAKQFLINQGLRSVPQVFVDGVHTNPKTITGEIID